MCRKTHLNNSLYQITAVCFEHEHELGLVEFNFKSIGTIFVGSGRWEMVGLFALRT